MAEERKPVVETAAVVVDRVAKERKRYVVSERGPRTFDVLDTDEADAEEYWLVVGTHGSKRLANAVAKDKNERWAEMGGR